jgi:hypothetical protein
MDASCIRNTSVALLAPVLWLCGCTGPADDNSQSQLSLKATGSTGIEATADSDIVAAVMTIDEIRLLPSPEQTLDSVVLLDDSTVVDMTGLAEMTTDLVKRSPIPAGRYQEIRFIVSGAYIQVAGDGVYLTPDYGEVPWGLPVAGELAAPSLGRSGLKVKLDRPLEVGPGLSSHTWLLRFDVAESFGHPAGDVKWVMHPVIFATSIDSTASIAVAVDTRSLTDTDKRFTVRLDDADNHPESRVDIYASGGYATAEMPYLLPAEGPYRLSLETLDGTGILTDPPLPTQISLKAGERLKVNAQATGVVP